MRSNRRQPLLIAANAKRQHRLVEPLMVVAVSFDEGHATFSPSGNDLTATALDSLQTSGLCHPGWSRRPNLPEKRCTLPLVEPAV